MIISGVLYFISIVAYEAVYLKWEYSIHRMVVRNPETLPLHIQSPETRWLFKTNIKDMIKMLIITHCRRTSPPMESKDVISF